MGRALASVLSCWDEHDAARSDGRLLPLVLAAACGSLMTSGRRGLRVPGRARRRVLLGARPPLEPDGLREGTHRWSCPRGRGEAGICCLTWPGLLRQATWLVLEEAESGA